VLARSPFESTSSSLKTKTS